MNTTLKKESKVSNEPNIIKITMDTSKKEVWDTAVNNIQYNGKKATAYFPMSLMYADPAFQRIDDTTPTRIQKLAANWDDNQMDDIMISLHPETYSASIINGYHRFRALQEIGRTYANVFIIQGLPTNPELRLRSEAKLFAEQDKNVHKLTAMQKHPANLICKVKANVNLDKLMKKYNLTIKAGEKGQRSTRQIGYLTGFSEALVKAGLDPKALDWTFRLLNRVKWTESKNGLSSDVIRCFFNMFHTHFDEKEKVLKIFKNEILNLEPDQFLARSKVKYNERSHSVAASLYAEDILVENGIERKYAEETTDFAEIIE